MSAGSPGTAAANYRAEPPDRDAACRCGHRRHAHGHDRRGRPTCFASAMCGCARFVVKENRQ